MHDPVQQPRKICSAEGCAQHPFTLNLILIIQVFEASNETIFICGADNCII